MGGGVFARAGSVKSADSRWIGNRTFGGRGGDGLLAGGNGGGGMGSALFSESADVRLLRCLAVENEARGGTAGNPWDHMQGERSGAGGDGEGAVFLSLGGISGIESSLVVSNRGMGGLGGTGKNGGPAGFAAGGARHRSETEPSA